MNARTNDRGMRRFIVRSLLFAHPILVAVGIYIWLDPFKVIHHYDSYFTSGGINPIMLNKDFVSTRNWLNHYPRYQYDSYIFGSSRSMFYQMAVWSRCIDAPLSHCYHFDASGETLFGIAKKLDFLQKNKVRIHNALVIMDAHLLKEAGNSSGHLFMKDPLISGEGGLDFQLTCLREFLTANFLQAYIDYKVTGKVKEYMKKEYLMNDIAATYDNITNEIQEKERDELIRTHPEKYYTPIERMFYPRSSNERQAPPVIASEQIILLRQIASVLSAQGSSYKIVISPLYEQVRLNPADLTLLQDLFGTGNVYDFSGINSFTASKYNYYEPEHYLPSVATAIMDSIYHTPGYGSPEVSLPRWQDSATVSASLPEGPSGRPNSPS